MTDRAVQDTSILESTVRLAAGGDELAFARLVGEHHPSMARVAYVICGDVDLARDAVQAAWTRAWRKLKDLRDPRQARAWLVSIAANEARQQIRHQRRRTVVELSVDADDRSTADPAGIIAIVDLERALRRLKPEDRSLLAMRYAAGLDSTEIATQLGLSASGVRTRLGRLLDRIRMDLDHA